MHYFAYGANINDLVLLKRRGIKIKSQTKTTLKNWDLVYNSPGANKYEPVFANVQEKSGEHVEGVAYEMSIDEYQAMLRSETCYKTVDVEVNTVCGQSIQAKTLIASRPIRAKTPSLRYKKLIIDGAKHKQFSPQYIDKLQNTAHAKPPIGYNFVCKFVAIYLRIRFFLQKRSLISTKG